MNVERIEGSELKDGNANDDFPKPPAGGVLNPLNIGDERLARIVEYEQQALSRMDPFAAIVGFQSATCSKMLEHYFAALVAELESYPHSLEDINQIKHNIRDVHKLRSAVEFDSKFANVDREESSGADRNGTRPKAIVNSDAKTRRNEDLPI